jgi:hypothetical protein
MDDIVMDFPPPAYERTPRGLATPGISDPAPTVLEGLRHLVEARLWFARAAREVDQLVADPGSTAWLSEVPEGEEDAEEVLEEREEGSEV